MDFVTRAGGTRSSALIDNTQLLRHLMLNKLIYLHDGHILSHTPAPLQPACGFEKVEGMLLGIAIGDALGATSEGLSPPERRRLYGEIRHYVPDRRPGQHRPAGVGTDDTQESFWTVEQLLDDRGLIPESLAHKFCKDRVWGAGGAIKEFVRNFKDKRLPWYQAGPDAKNRAANLGNGALMRIAPIVLPYLRDPHPSMYADAAIDAMMTHNGFANTGTCVSFVHMLWELLGMRSVPRPDWWADTYCSVARELEGNTTYEFSSKTQGDYSGPLCEFVSSVCRDALRRGLTVEEACEAWGSGGSLFETVPSVLHILATHADDPEQAIVRAVNDTRDNDSIASIVGAAIGALHGLGGIPERWVKHLNGRIRDGGGGGQVYRLILHSKHVFWLNS